MKQLKLFEFEKCSYKKLEEYGLGLKDAIRKFDEHQAKINGGPLIFNWSYRDYFQATHYVGVIQIENFSIEILPKVDCNSDSAEQNYELAQNNLLYMLSTLKSFPLLEKNVAKMAVKNESFLDVIVGVFLTTLVLELNKGPDRHYIPKEENLRAIKGKLLVHPHLQLNGITSPRAFCRHDEFSDNTTINRILKSACKLILQFSRCDENKIKANKCLSKFDAVDDTQVVSNDYQRIIYSKNNSRFSIITDFAWILIQGHMTSPSAGLKSTFSFVFSMHRLFEEFIATLIKQNANDFGLSKNHIHAQAKGHNKWLLKDVMGSGKYQLKPDILIQNQNNETLYIIDTKWKVLRNKSEESQSSASRSDLYQLFAYAKVYNCAQNILLYPTTPGVIEKNFIANDHNEDKIHVKFVNLNRNLRLEMKQLILELKNTLFKAA